MANNMYRTVCSCLRLAGTGPTLKHETLVTVTPYQTVRIHCHGYHQSFIYYNERNQFVVTITKKYFQLKEPCLMPKLQRPVWLKNI